MIDVHPAQTSVPDWMMIHCHQISLADAKYRRKLNNMYLDMLEGFLNMKPYKANPPLPWYTSRMHAYRSGTFRENADYGWIPMNMRLPTELIDKIKQEIEYINLSQVEERKLSLRTFLYTAVVWWCSWIHPYDGLKSMN
jgi:hypothetical protein